MKCINVYLCSTLHDCTHETGALSILTTLESDETNLLNGFKLESPLYGSRTKLFRDINIDCYHPPCIVSINLFVSAILRWKDG
jgi:hypothetical protein